MILLDTHVLIWGVNNDARLGRRAAEIVEAAARDDAVCVSAITPWEIALLASKSRLSLGCGTGLWIEDALTRPGVRLVPLEPAIAVDSVELPGQFHGDPADRILVATARRLDIQLLTADRATLAYAAAGHLKVFDASV